MPVWRRKTTALKIVGSPEGRQDRSPRNPERVNVKDELNYWCRVFDCTPQQLRTAVNAVGVFEVKVRAFLSGPGEALAPDR